MYITSRVKHVFRKGKSYTKNNIPFTNFNKKDIIKWIEQDRINTDDEENKFFYSYSFLIQGKA
jgi:hypothetical protein